MSMPTFPESGIDLTKEQAFLMLLGSIAMEELALSHIMNAEGEKLQYILGTLPNSPCNPCPTTSEILEVNKSISDLLERVAQNQILLKSKLAQVLEAMEHCLPCEPKPTPPKPPSPCCCNTNTCVLCSPKDFCWCINSPLPLKPVYQSNCCFNWWHRDTPSYIYLPQNKPVVFNYKFSLYSCECRNISFSIQALKNGVWDEISYIDDSNLSGNTVLYPDPYKQGFSPIAIFLKNPANINIKSISLCLTEL